MYKRYHVETTERVLGAFFSRSALGQILQANVGQDSIRGLFGTDAHRHFLDPVMARSWAYVDAEHATIAELAGQAGQAERQRAAFGRLLHTVQDFYAHSNYVDLWLAQYGDRGADAIDGLDGKLMRSPHLRVGEWVFWRDSLYYIPVLGSILRRVWLPERSHEAMKLDSPAQGPRFALALATARQRTMLEYQRAVSAIARAGGMAAVMAFQGVVPARAMQWAGVPSVPG